MKAEKEELHNPSKSEEEKIAKINALSEEVIEDTKDVKRIQSKLNKGAKNAMAKLGDDEENPEDPEEKAERASKKGMDPENKKKMKEAKKKAVEIEKAEEAAEKAAAGGGDDKALSSDDAPGSAGRITSILKQLEEEIVARSSKDADPPAAPIEKPCTDGMQELKKYFSGKEGVKRS